ncbi:MAG: bifunctional riboflavin kinase/FAD synthetase [Acidaminococcaceae bacterium]|jgi:riboflavin kinase/FMN adenylyltransferase|nr:bifunctional riboflavin kinase/FAD synthetase [Acidaminococcaceae bacterium]
MKIITSLANLQTHTPCVLALGTFDGLHRGHLDVIGTARNLAQKLQLQTAVFTFSNHPYACINPARVPVALLSETDKLAMLKQVGVDLLLDIPFDEQLASLTPDAFLAKLQPLQSRCLVVGENFSYGFEGNGNTDSLKLAGAQLGFQVIVRPLLTEHGNIISSTAIRNLIQAGKLVFANKMLGRTYSVTGVVAPGFKRGRTLGFPTANLYLDRSKVALPPAGVYAVQITIPSDKIYAGMANLGLNPTFTDVRQEVLESHLFDFQAQLYGQTIRVAFARCIRPEKKFTSVAALQAQIKADETQVRSFWKWARN